jgi:hypothetical protein
MKGSLRISFVVAVCGSILGIGSFSHLAEAQDQPEPPVFELRVAYLKDAGLRLPPEMPRVRDVMSYQARLSTHQEVTVEWHLIPGRNDAIPRDHVVEGSLAPDFFLLDRKQGLRGNARVSTLTLSDMTLVTAAVTSSGEVRGLVVGPGSPILQPERRRNDRGQTGGETVVFAKSTFVLYLPDDPKIDKLVFLLSHPDGEKYRLERVGTLELKKQSPPNS